MGDSARTVTGVLALDTLAPHVAEEAWVAPGATVVGAVRLAAYVGVWYGAVLRGDGDRIDVGPRSNIQDGCVVHADPGFPVSVGAGVTVGHRAVVHGARLDDNVLVGMGAVLMNGVTVGEDVLIAAGTVLLGGTEIRPRSLVAGVPGRVRRELTEQEIDDIRGSAQDYVFMARRHAAACHARLP